METSTKNCGAAVNDFLEFMEICSSWNKKLGFKGAGKPDRDEYYCLNMPKYDLMPNFARKSFICKFSFLMQAMWTEMLQSDYVVEREVVTNLKQVLFF